MQLNFYLMSLQVFIHLLYMTYKYSRTSLARTRMARIPWIARKPIVIAYLPYKQHEV